MFQNIEPLAIIGLACRFPQDASDPEKLWELLLAGRSAATPVPPSKFNVDGHYHPDPGRGGSVYTRVGNFLAEDTALFDASFFSMSKADVLAMDPQQRLIMENVYHALENAGLSTDSIAGSSTSVFVAGGFNQDYLHMLVQDPEMVLKKKPTGTTPSILSNRISWLYDLRGTSMTVDTACSSSLTALHQACMNLHSGESDMTIVSGVNTMDIPTTFTTLGAMGILSPDGKTYSFDHRANGYGRGEGVGSLIIKPLRAALKDGNTIRAIIRATGSNQDGRTPGITHPNTYAQADLIRRVYDRAGLDMHDTDYVEAHGSATAVGDPNEAHAIAAAFQTETRDRFLYIGSIKQAIGHLEAAAGIAGIIKAVLMLEKGLIPPASNFEKPNPKIPLAEVNIQIPTNTSVWPATRLRRISINSFGFGGTNGHVILDDAYSFLRDRNLDGLHSTTIDPDMSLLATYKGHDTSDMLTLKTTNHAHPTLPNGVSTINGHGRPPYRVDLTLNSSTDACFIDSAISVDENAADYFALAHRTRDVPSRKDRLFIISAFDKSGIQRNSVKLSKYLKAAIEKKQLSAVEEDQRFTNLAYTLTSKRTSFSWKAFCVASSPSMLAEHLLTEISKPMQPFRQERRLGFVFTGQGAQWPTMGQALRVYPIYRQRIEEASEYMKMLGSPWDLQNGILQDKAYSRINDPLLSQAACTAIQVALIDLLASWNIVPVRVCGHSSGEIAAAYCAGFVTREDAWKLAYARGLVSAKQLERNGAMMAVGMSVEAIQPYLQAAHKQVEVGELVVACFNSPKNITISGDEELIDALYKALQKDQLFARKLAVRNAYHSSHMKAVANDYRWLMGRLERTIPKKASSTQMFSSVTARRVYQDEVQTAEYWVRNLVSPVRFSEALVAMVSNPELNGETPLLNTGTREIIINEVLEVGPHAALRSAIRESLAVNHDPIGVEYSNVLTRNTYNASTLLSSVGSLYCRGYSVDLSAVNETAGTARMLTDLPPYEYNHNRSYWTESRLSKNFRYRKFPRQDLLGAPVSDWDPAEPRWRGFVRASELPWIKDHTITKLWVYPAAGYLAMALEAVKQMADPTQRVNRFKLQDVSIKSALIIPDTPGGVEYMFSMRRAAESSLDKSHHWWEFRVSSYYDDNGLWTEHCIGRISLEYKAIPEEVESELEESLEAERHASLIATAQATCQYPFPIHDPYDGWNKLGLSFGSTFRNVSDPKLGHGIGESLSTVTIPDIAGCMPKAFAQNHTVQPAFLDSILGTFMIARLDLTRFNNAELPTFIKDVWISASIPNQPLHKFDCHTQTKRVSPKNYRSSMLLWDPSTREAKVQINGLETQPLLSATTGADNDGEGICHYIHAQPDVTLLSKGSAVFRNMLQTRSDINSRLSMLERYQILSMLFIFRALDELDSTDIETLVPHHQSYIDWAKSQMKRSASGSLVLCDSQKLKDLLLDNNLQQRFLGETTPSDAAEQILLRVGPQIGAILKCEVDPLELIFRGDGLIDRFYAEVSTPMDLPALFESYLKALAHTFSDLKVLEIGAGTGSATSRVLEALSQRKQYGNGPLASTVATYTYTDISAGFFETAKVKFSDWKKCMEFKMLNIEDDPTNQGFDKGGYDVIIASNVLHATTDLKKTLMNTRSLLRSGGKLILLEIVQPDHLLNPTCFGILPGWWLSTENFRGNGPLTSEAQWDSMLTENGFNGADLVLRDTEDEMAHQMSVFVSTASSAPAISAHYPKPVRLICSNPKQIEQEYVSNLGMKMREAGFQECTPIDYHDLLLVDLKDCLCVVLLGLDSLYLSEMDNNEFANIQHLLSTTSWLLWVSEDQGESPAQSLVTGLIRSVRSERELNEPNLATLEVENSPPNPADLADKIVQLSCRHFEGSPVLPKNGEYLLRDGEFWSTRIQESSASTQYLKSESNDSPISRQAFGGVNSCALKLTSLSPGMLDKLVFEDDAVWEFPLAENEVEVKIGATSLDFRDVMIATGQLADIQFGTDAAGTITRVGSTVQQFQPGDRVIVLSPGSQSSTFATFCRVAEDYVVSIPAQMTFEEAGALPVLYITALHGLDNIGRLVAEETVLIHDAAGSVGQAAIQVAQLDGAEILATVSTSEQKDLLMETYGMTQDHIFSSRDLSFVKGIQRITNGRGVDVIFNLLSGEALRRSWECIAPFGRFIDLERKDIDANGRLQMSPFGCNTLYFAMDPKTFIEQAPKKATALVRKAMDLFIEGKIHIPQPLTVFSFAEIEYAFRQLSSGKITGKIMIKPHDTDMVPVLAARNRSYQFTKEFSYVLAGGLGGIGRSLAKWMVSRGARNLIFLSRSGAASQASQKLLNQLEKASCQFKVYKCDVADKIQLSEVVKDCELTLPPIRGCIQASMVLDDSMFGNMAHSKFQAALNPKVKGSYNLHHVLGEKLDFFIMLSSMTSIVGNRGQANYASGNSYQEAFAKHLVHRGFNAAAINFGSIKSVGYVAENMDKVQKRGEFFFPWDEVSEEQMHSIIEYHMNPNKDPNAGYQTIIGLMTASQWKHRGLTLPPFMSSPLFTHLHDTDNTVVPNTDEEVYPVERLLKSVDSLKAAAVIVAEAIQHKLSSMMSMPKEEIDVQKPLLDFGVDSLVAVEIRTWIARTMGADVPVLDILRRVSVVEIGEKVASLSSLVKVSC